MRCRYLDYHHGMPFDGDRESDYPEGHSLPKCKTCGDYNVRWRQQGGKWVLFSLEPGKIHVCDTSDDFGVVK